MSTFDPDFWPDTDRIDRQGNQWKNRGGVWTTVTKSTDPAMALIRNPDVFSVPDESIYDPTCYICVDPEFAAMGLPLCYPCFECKAHVPADDPECANGHDQMEGWLDSDSDSERDSS